LHLIEAALEGSGTHILTDIVETFSWSVVRG
jgi:hypothetical protein